MWASKRHSPTSEDGIITANEAPQLTSLLQQFGNSLSAFASDMGDRMADIVLVTMSEFGRTAKEDGNGGTDHGHGNVMMVLGGPVRGGKFMAAGPAFETGAAL